jgi:ferric-dicitrate binding protein FerR (iron transport regulator)
MESGTDRPVDWKLLTRYVAGDCSGEERVVVEAWAASDPRGREILEDLRRAWEAVGREEGDSPVDVDAAWDELSRKMQEAGRDSPPHPQAPVPAGDRPAQQRGGEHHYVPQRRLRAGAAAAAALVLVLAGALLWASGWLGSKAGPDGKVFTTERGQRAVVDLTDGTQVHLNADSRLVLPGGRLGEKRRTVRLDGEAFFDVARDTARPFRVRTGGANVRVLGTAFNVQSYSGDETRGGEAAATTQVAVAEGEVTLQASKGQTGSPAGDTIRLAARQVGVSGPDGALDARRDVDLSAQLAWTEGRLAFEDASFREVMRKLERWYDLRVEVRAPLADIDRLNAHFDDESLREILGDVAVALSLRYERTGDTVIFFRPGARSSTRPGTSSSAHFAR